MKRSRIGLHVSAAGGVENAPLNAQTLGCEVFQFFSRSPRGGGAKPITESSASLFQERVQEMKGASYIHAPYYINFASENNRISFGSVSAIREELERGSALGATYVMTHLGSRRDLGEKDALKQVIVRIKDIFAKKQSWTTELLLENSAGAENVVGDTFEELGAIWKGIGRKNIGICLDTCHLFASGYDIRTPAAITKTMKEYAKHLPLSTFKLVHANDSKFDFDLKRDRHADIGDGHLGVKAFEHLLAHPAFQGRDFVLETPGEDLRRKKDVVLLQKLRDKGQ